MPTMRTPIKRHTRSGQITPQVIAAYQRALAMHDDPKHRWLQRHTVDVEDFEFEESSQEYRDACSHLEALLGDNDIKVLDTLGLDVVVDHPLPGWGNIEDWNEAVRLRLEIERASDAAKR